MLAAAGATLLVSVGIVGIPLVNACAPTGSSLIACLRDMADRKFDLPGEPPQRTTAAAGESSPSVTVPIEVSPPTVPPVAPSPEIAAETPAPRSASAEPPAPQQSWAPRQVEPVAEQSDVGQGGPLLPPRRPETARPAPAPAPTTLPIQRQAAIDPEPAAPQPPPVPPAALPPAPVPELEALTMTPIEDQPEPPDVAMLPEPVEAAEPAATTVVPRTPSPAALVPEIEGNVPDPAPAVAASDVPLPENPSPDIAAPVILAPTIDAIELEGAASYVSGSGPTGAIIRLYSDGKLLGESTVEEGRWLVEAGEILDEATTELRVEAIEPESGKSLGNSVITVEIEPPAEEPAEPAPEVAPPAPPPAEAPATTDPSPPVDPEPAVPPSAPDPSPPPRKEAPAVSPTPSGPLVPPADEPVDVDLPEHSGLDEPILPATEPPEALVPEPQGDDGEAAEIEVPAELPPLASVRPDKSSASVEILDAPDAGLDTLPPLDATDDDPATIALDPPDSPALMAEFELPEQRPEARSVVVLRLFPFGDPVYGRYSGGQAIIRRGDTLWSLAHRYYGAGIHFRTIYDANRDKISRPSKIYPGQIFDLPLVTEE